MRNQSPDLKTLQRNDSRHVSRGPVFLCALLLSLGVLTSCGQTPASSFSSATQSVIDPSSSSVEPASNALALAAMNAPNKAANSGKHNRFDAAYRDSLRRFSEKVFDRIENDASNLVFSPLSIATCFSMAYEGAANKSKEELASFLCYDEEFDLHEQIQNMHLCTRLETKDEEGYRSYLDVAESFFLDRQFKDYVKQEYLDVLEEYYFAEAYEASLSSTAAHKMLADWINGKTFDYFHLDEDSFRGLGGLFWLVNAVYLKSPWQDKPGEFQRAFTDSNGNVSEVPTLRFVDDEHYAWSSDRYDVADLRLGNGLVFRVMQEKDGANPLGGTPLDALLDPDTFVKGHKEYDFTCQMPIFESHSKFDLLRLFASELPTATKLGKADFSGIADPKDCELYLSGAIHEAGIKVRKEGVEAAAYTVIVAEGAINSVMIPHPKMEIILDKPFRYAVLTTEGYPLFMGKVNTVE